MPGGPFPAGGFPQAVEALSLGLGTLSCGSSRLQERFGLLHLVNEILAVCASHRLGDFD
jgi:hypothetical protein